MNRAEVSRDPAADPRERFVRRPPSQAWEPIAAADRPTNSAWAWFKPPAVPNGLLLRLAPEAFQAAGQSAWTMRQLLLAAGVDPVCVLVWHVNGAAFPGAHATNPLLDLPVPAPVPGADPNIAVTVALPNMPAFPPGMPVAGVNGAPGTAPLPGMPMGAFVPGAMPMMAPGPVMPTALAMPLPGMPLPALAAPGMPAPGMPAARMVPVPMGAASARMNGKHEPVIPAAAHLLEAYEHVEQDWRSSQDTEKDLARLRQQLLDMMGRLKTLNRDLTGPERVHSNNQEKKDWQQARRMLRDCTNRLWKCVKAHDIGYTSSAGQRRWFEETYEKYIAPRRHFDGFLDADRAFGTYRKIVTTLHIEMSNALSIAQLDGERRAQQVLARIAEKIREAGNRKNFLGVMLDS